MSRLADQIKGRGTASSVTYLDLRCLLNVISRFKEADFAEQALPPKPVAIKPNPSADALAEAAVAFADIVENYAELWGTSGPNAIAAWAAQQPKPPPARWVRAVEKALKADVSTGSTVLDRPTLMGGDAQ